MKKRAFAMSYRSWILVLVASITAVLLIAQYFLNYRVVKDLHQSQIAESNNIIALNVQSMMQFPLISGDVTEVKRLSDSLLNHDIIWAIETRNESGEIVHRSERPAEQKTLSLSTTTVQIYDDANPISLTFDAPTDPDSLVGEVRIYFTNKKKLDRLESELHTRTLISTFIVVLTGLVLFYLILNVSNFVAFAKEQMLKISAGQYDVRIGRSRVRELNEMTKGIENMSLAFKQKVIALEEQTQIAEQGRRSAEHHSQFKTEMMRLISHELRTPVHVIVNLLESLQVVPGQTDREVSAKMAIVKKSAAELLSVVDELVDMRMFEEGQVTLNCQEWDLAHVVHSTCDRFKAKFTYKNIDFEVTPPYKASTRIIGVFDKGKFERILANLITNAYKFTHHGRVEVHWSVEIHDTSHLRVVVKDTGIGISKDDQRHIFEQFYQVGAVSTRQGGMGIGLTWVENLLKVMDGTIEIESELGRGAAFTVCIPIQLSQASSDTASPSLGLHHTKGHNALVIDDREDNCMVMVEMLKLAGIDADFSTDPKNAIELARSSHYDFVLIDYHMPEMDGASAARILRQHGQNATCVMICITADATITTQETLSEEGIFDSILIKPIEGAVLIDRMEQALIVKRQMIPYQSLRSN